MKPSYCPFCFSCFYFPRKLNDWPHAPQFRRQMWSCLSACCEMPLLADDTQEHYLRRHLNTTTMTVPTVPWRKPILNTEKLSLSILWGLCDTGHGPDPSGALPSSRRPILWHHRVTVFLFLPEWSHHNNCIIWSYGVTYISPLTKDKFKERKWQHQHCLFSKSVVSAL